MAHSDSSLRTPLGKVRGLGSAKEGADHFFQQRVTAVANLILGIIFVALVVSLVGADYSEARQTLASPLVAVPLLLLIISGIYHMRLGMQVVIEDYVSHEGLKIVGLMLNTFFAAAVGLTCIFAIVKLSFGG